MKQIISLCLLLSVLLLAAGCGDSKAPEVDQEGSVHSGEEGAREDVGRGDGEEKDPALAPLEEVLLDPIERRILLPVNQEKLEAMGVEVRAHNIQIPQQVMRDIVDIAGELTLDSSWTMLPKSVYEAVQTTPWGTKEAGFPFTFDLTLTHQNGERKVFTIEANAYYSGELTGNIKPVWGSISVIDDDTIALSTLQDISFYNSADFTQDVSRNLNLSAFTGRPFAVNSVAFHDPLGYVVPMYLDGKNYLALFGEDGNLKESRLVDEQEYRGLNNEPIWYLTYFGEVSIIDLDVPTLVFEDKSYSGNNVSMFRTDDYKGVSYAPFFDIDSSMAEGYFAISESERVYLYSTTHTEGTPYNGEITGIVAVYETDAGQRGYAQFGVDIPIRWDFGMLRENEQSSEMASFDRASNVFSLYSAAGGQRLTVDFNTHSGDLVYDIREDMLEYEVDASPNLRYQLWQANSSGMGDAYWGNLALKDTQTGTITYVGEYGSGYITNPMDFLDDETLLYKPSVLHVVFIHTADAQPYKETQLAYSSAVEGRVSFNATYDTQGDRYFVAYIDGNTHDGYPRDFSTENYEVAVFDGQGKQIETIPTKIPGSTGPIYSLYCPPMKVSGSTLWLDGKAVEIGQQEAEQEQPAREPTLFD